MKRSGRHIAVFLLFISLFFAIPKELLHELSFHNDTVDHCINSPTDGLAFSNEHHHCDILQVFVQPYHVSDHCFHFSQPDELISHYTFNISSFSFEVAGAFVIRGPPASVSFC